MGFPESNAFHTEKGVRVSDNLCLIDTICLYTIQSSKNTPTPFTDIYLLCFFVLLFYLCDTRQLCRCLIRAEPFSQIESRHAKNTHYCCYVCSLVYYIVLLFS